MTRPPSWRAIATTLAERMSHHAHCEYHPEATADPDCPFCRDRAAYRAWEQRSGQTFVHDVPGDAVDLAWVRQAGTDTGGPHRG